MGRIGAWAPLAGRFPALANLLTSAPVFGSISKWAAGVAEQRRLPVFAKKTYRASAKSQPDAGRHGRRVILWVDTFNDHFTPEVARASAKVLDALGYDVVLPEKRLCCGRPLYDYGMLDEARALLLQAVSVLADDIRAGVPIVGLEPGCLSVFKDELLKQLPGDALATRLSAQTHLFSDFIAEADFDWPRLDASVLVHGHCHQKALFGMKRETALLDKLGVRWTLADTGCCGMAGSFGFNAEHYDLSMKIAGQKLLPLVRAAQADTLIVTNGFSCREQIEHGTGRHTLHIAQLALRALESGTSQAAAPTPSTATFDA